MDIKPYYSISRQDELTRFTLKGKRGSSFDQLRLEIKMLKYGYELLGYSRNGKGEDVYVFVKQ